MNNSDIINVAIVDDDITQLTRIMKVMNKLKTSYPQFFANIQFCECDNAHKVAKAISNAIDKANPPYDVILSDVFMPAPPDLHFQHLNRYKNNFEEEIENGGFHIAKAILQTYKNEIRLNQVPVSICLISVQPEPIWKHGLYKEFLKYPQFFFFMPKPIDCFEKEELPKSHKPMNEIAWGQALRNLIAYRNTNFWGRLMLRADNNKLYVALNSSESMKVYNTITHEIKTNKDELILILVSGEQGTGKELIARRIHFLRSETLKDRNISTHSIEEGNFIPINCAVKSNDLVELMNVNEHDTLYIDQFQEMEVSAQNKLLQVINDRSQKNTECPDEKDLQFRGSLIIASTDSPIKELRKNIGHYLITKFKNIYVLPPLRERIPDIVPAAECYLETFSEQDNEQFKSHLTESAKECLENQSITQWPDNFKDLMFLMEKASENGDVFEITEEHLKNALNDPKFDAVPASRDTAHWEEKMNRQSNQAINVTYNVSGANPMFNMNSNDYSSNVVNTESTEIFIQLKRLLPQIDNEKEKEAIEGDIQAMEASYGTSGFINHYQNFMANIANHMTVFAPLIPALANLLT
jgi:DNA-binding NtrC family response regulator